MKRDDRDGRDYLIEVNPRSWLWVGLATSCGVNLPYACWLDAVGRPRTWPTGHRGGRRWVLASKHLAGSARELRRGEWSLRPFLSSLRPPISDGVIDPRDPRPALALYSRIARAAPCLSCGCASTARARPSPPGPGGCWRRSPRRSAPTPVWTDGEADLVYAPDPPASGLWIPADLAAQAFFEGDRPFPAEAVHRSRDLTLLFPPTHPEGPIPGDLVASAFHLLARWDELRVPERDRFGRLPLAASSFGRIAGLDLEDPPVEGYLAALRAGLRIPPPRSWSVALTHDIDRLRRRTARGLAGIARRRGPRGLAAALVGPDPWNNVPDLLESAWRRGVRSTVFLIGRNAHPLDGTPAARLRARPAGPGGRGARRRRRGGPARRLRLLGGRRRPGRRARRPARRGRARSPACASTTCASATTRPCGGSSAPARSTTPASGSARPRGSRRASRGPSGPTWWARSARPPCACCRSR